MRAIVLAFAVALLGGACLTRPAAPSPSITALAALRADGVSPAFPDSLVERLISIQCAITGPRNVLPYQSLAVGMIETEMGRFDAGSGALVLRIQRDGSLCGAPRPFTTPLADLEAEVVATKEDVLGQVAQLVTLMSATAGDVAPTATAPTSGVLRFDVQLPGVALADLAGVSHFMVLAFGLIRPALLPIEFAVACGTSEPALMVVATGAETLTTLTSAELQARLGGLSTELWLAEARQP
ncbi:MAG: hypothetical protein ABIZ34_04430 [Candidatus Limnocylindrales bacterium]